MGSRRFFYVLPSPGSRLDSAHLLSTLTENGFGLDPVAFYSQQDGSGIVTSAREVHLGNRPVQRARGLLDATDRLDVLLGDTELALACSFGSPHDTPICTMNVLQKQWFGLREEIRSKYERTLASAATNGGAEFILVIDDPSDDFLGRLQPVDSEWLVDQVLPDGSEQDVASVWVATDSSGRLEIPGFTTTGRRIGPFKEMARRSE